MSREAMQMALDMLNEIADDVYCDQKLEGVIAVLRQALVDADDTSQKRVDETAKHKHIKTWSERCEEHPDHQHGMVSKSMIQARMQEEIDELRQALETDLARVGEVGVWGEWQGLTDDEVNELVARFKRYSYVLLREVEAKLKEKNGG